MKYNVIIVFLTILGTSACNNRNSVVSQCELTEEENKFYEMATKYVESNPEYKTDPVKFIIVDRSNGRLVIVVKTVGGITHTLGLDE